jgi:hydroxymethylbilane synthase
LRIGTRGSLLAVAQAEEVRNRLSAEFELPFTAFEIVKITTSGDLITDRPLKEIGGKGLFTKEIEHELLTGTIDIAVHSMKDMPVLQPGGLQIDSYLPREDIRDAFLSFEYSSIDDLPKDAILGTSSVRRTAQVLNFRNDLQVIDFRGNVQTRLKKLRSGIAFGTLLAMAGLNRLQVSDVPIFPIEISDMLPAVAQGVIGIERRVSDLSAAHLLERINDYKTERVLSCERAYLKALDGSCQTPIAGCATLEKGNINFKAEIIKPDGSQKLTESGVCLEEDAEELGIELAERLRSKSPCDFFSWL